MPRVKRGVHAKKRKKKIMKAAKGFTLSNRRMFLRAKQVLERAMAFSTRDRKQRKRHFRELWITRIGAAAKAHGMSYSKFMSALKKANINLNRKILAHLAVAEPKVFEALTKVSKA